MIYQKLQDREFIVCYTHSNKDSCTTDTGEISYYTINKREAERHFKQEYKDTYQDKYIINHIFDITDLIQGVQSDIIREIHV